MQALMLMISNTKYALSKIKRNPDETNLNRLLFQVKLFKLVRHPILQ